MAKKTRKVSEKQKKEEADRKMQHKLSSIKTDFEAGKIKNFEPIFAIIGPSVWAKLMHMGYDTFLSKSKNPGEFSNNELVRFAELINIDPTLVLKLIFSLMKVKVNLSV